MGGPKSVLHLVRNYYRGYGSSGIQGLDGFRDEIAANVFAFMSMYLKRRPAADLDTMIMNTCCLSPSLPTLAHFADWSLHQWGFSGNLDVQPGLVFVKSDHDYLVRFYRDYLPRIDAGTRFVLITGDSDFTLPRQVDQRAPGHDESMIAMLRSIHDDPRLAHWFAQNLDEAWPGISPIPLGFWEKGGTSLYRQVLKAQADPPAIGSRPLRVLCAHRMRTGPQWSKRQSVTQKALGEWASIVDYKDEIPASDFFDVISGYPFVMCVGGGGLDPSPKAWTALLAGCIPMMEMNATTKAYENLPVVYVEDWDRLDLSIDVLRSWLERLSPHFDQPELRRAVLEQLSMGHWLRLIRAGGRQEVDPSLP